MYAIANHLNISQSGNCLLVPPSRKTLHAIHLSISLAYLGSANYERRCLWRTNDGRL
jgi:hypothetical protein